MAIFQPITQAADLILGAIDHQGGSASRFKINEYLRDTDFSQYTEDGLRILQNEGFIKSSKQGSKDIYSLTNEGGLFKNRAILIKEYLEEKEQQISTAKQKDEMQIETGKFTMTMDKWLLLLAGGGFLLGIINFIKDLLFK